MRTTRSMEFMERALDLAASDPIGAAALAARALEADAGSPAAVAIHGHLDADLEGACDFYARLDAPVPVPPGVGAACVDLALAVLRFAAGDPESAIPLTAVHVAAPLPACLSIAVARIHVAAALCLGDLASCDDGLAVLARNAPGSPEAAWFRFLRAVRSGGRHGDALREAVSAWPGVPAAILLPPAIREAPANPACLHEGGGLVHRARGAVLPVFAALPDAVAALVG